MDATTTNYSESDLSEKHLWGYGLGNFGFGAISQIINSYFVFYATAILGLPGTLVGLIVGISIIWDAVSDPIMGYVSDFTINKRFGRRHLYLWIGGITMMLSNGILWHLNADLPRWFLVVTLAVMLLLVKTAMTMYGTPYSALGAEMIHDHVKRTKIQSIRMTFFMLGIFFATAITMLFFFRATDAYQIGQLNPQGYRTMGIVTSLIVMATSLISIFSTKHIIPRLNARLPQKSNASILDFFKSLKGAFDHRDLRVVIIGYLFTNLAAAILNAVGLHVYTYTFSMNNNAIALTAGGQLLIAVFSQPFWLWLNKHQDKVVSIRLGLTLSMIASLYFIFAVVAHTLVSEHLWLLTPFVILAGVGSGGLFTLPQAMVADAVDENALATGSRQEGVYYGTLTLSYKLSQSLAILMIGIFVDLVGFDSGLAIQEPSTVINLGLFLGLGTLISFIAARISYKFYTLNRVRMKEIHHALFGISSSANDSKGSNDIATDSSSTH